MSNLELNPSIIGTAQTLRTTRRRFSRSQNQIVESVRETTGIVSGYAQKTSTTAEGVSVSEETVIFADGVNPVTITWTPDAEPTTLSGYNTPSDQQETVTYVATVNNRGMNSVEFVSAGEAEAPISE
jgi:hypothetical protein